MLLQVKVKANAKINRALKIKGGYLEVFVSPPREKGLANKALIKTLSDFFGIPKSSIEIKKGLTSVIKSIEIEKCYANKVFSKLSSL